MGLGWEVSNYAPGGVWMIELWMAGCIGNKDDHFKLTPDKFVINKIIQTLLTTTNLKFSIADKSMETLEIFNILGENIMEVLNDELDVGTNYKC